MAIDKVYKNELFSSIQNYTKLYIIIIVFIFCAFRISTVDVFNGIGISSSKRFERPNHKCNFKHISFFQLNINCNTN